MTNEQQKRLEEIREKAFAYHEDQTPGTYIEDLQFLLELMEDMNNVLNSVAADKLIAEQENASLKEQIRILKAGLTLQNANNKGFKQGAEEACDELIKENTLLKSIVDVAKKMFHEAMISDMSDEEGKLTEQFDKLLSQMESEVG